MEQLKLLVEMVSDLPEMAIWVLLGFWVYKIIIVGSLYGCIKYAIKQTHSVLTRQKYKDGMYALKNHVLYGVEPEDIVTILARVARHNDTTSGSFFASDLRWLRQAVEERISRDEGDA